MRAIYSPYHLKKKTKLNSQEQTDTQRGVLVKIIEGDSWGVADLCPKPELEDDSLENEIKNKGFLYLRAVELALEDLEARRAKVSLLKNKFVKNNFLITDYNTADLNQALYANQTIKIKADRDIRSLSQILNNLIADVKIRIDFNSILTHEEYETFLNLLSSEAKAKIEYIEDPTIFNIKWKNWNNIIPLAFDFQQIEYNPEFAKYLIVKPSRQRLVSGLKNFTLTSAMDHPVGVAHGLRMAQNFAQNDSGFLTLDLFEKTDFDKYFDQNGSYLNFSSTALNDFGIGMCDELNKLKWVEL